MKRRDFLQLSSITTASALTIGLPNLSSHLLFEDLLPKELFYNIGNPGVDRYTNRTVFLKYGDMHKQRFDVSNCIDIVRALEYSFSDNAPVARVENRCLWSHLIVGEEITLSLDAAFCECTYCGTAISYYGPATYNGHIFYKGSKYEAFSILAKHSCSHCNEPLLRGYRELCRLQDLTST